MPDASRRAAGVMLALVLIWGYAWVLGKLALAFCGPLDLAALRTAVGVVALFPALIWLRKPLKPEHPWEALGVGVIQTGLFLILNNWALSLAGAGKTSVLVFTMPFWVLVFAWPELGESIQRLTSLAVAIAAAGLVFILEPWTHRSDTLAEVLAVLAGVCWALGVVISKRLQNRHPVDGFNFTFWQMALGLLPMSAVALAMDSQPIEWTQEFVALLLVLGVVATAGGWGMWFYVLQRMPAGITSMSSLGIPVVALLASVAQLGERPTDSEWVGVALIAAALAIVSWDTMRRTRKVAVLGGSGVSWERLGGSTPIHREPTDEA